MPDWFLIVVLIMIFLVGVIVIVELFVLTALLVVLKRLSQEMRERMDPVIVKLHTLLEMVTDTMETVQSNTEHIAANTARTSDAVSDRVDKTSGLVQQAVAAPLIGGMSLARGIAGGLRAWSSQRRRRGRRHPPPDTEAAPPAP